MTPPGVVIVLSVVPAAGVVGWLALNEWGFRAQVARRSTMRFRV